MKDMASILEKTRADLNADMAKIQRALDGLDAIEELYGKTASTFPVELPVIVPAETKRPGRKQRKSIDRPGVFECDYCGADDFKSKAAVSMHRRSCDGVRRTKQERAKASSDRWLAKKAKGVETEKRPHRESKMPLPMKTPVRVDPVPIALRCPSCPETFATMRALGIHQSRLHFSDRSMSGSSLGGM